MVKNKSIIHSIRTISKSILNAKYVVLTAYVQNSHKGEVLQKRISYIRKHRWDDSYTNNHYKVREREKERENVNK